MRVSITNSTRVRCDVSFNPADIVRACNFSLQQAWSPLLVNLQTRRFIFHRCIPLMRLKYFELSEIAGVFFFHPWIPMPLIVLVLNTVPQQNNSSFGVREGMKYRALNHASVCYTKKGVSCSPGPHHFGCSNYFQRGWLSLDSQGPLFHWEIFIAYPILLGASHTTYIDIFHMTIYETVSNKFWLLGSFPHFTPEVIFTFPALTRVQYRGLFFNVGKHDGREVKEHGTSHEWEALRDQC